MSAFDEDFAEFVLPDHLGQFGRSVTVLPPNGPSRVITAIITEDDRRVEEGEYVQEDQERIWLTCRRDESHADGGIANPQTHLALIHPDETDDTTPFTYQGERRNVTPDCWDLLFARNRMDAIRPRRP